MTDSYPGLTKVMDGNDTVSRTEFEQALQAAVDQRTRRYAQNFALALQFELDNTKADRDTANFQSILRAFGLTPAEEYVIKASDLIHGWALRERLIKLLTTASTTPGRSLISPLRWAWKRRSQRSTSLSGKFKTYCRGKTPY